MKKLFAAWGVAAIAAFVINMGLLAAAIWVVVKILRYLQVIPA